VALVMADTLLPTTVVGSYPQPDWLIDRERLVAHGPVRVRARDLWRVAEPFLEEAQDDATTLAIRDMERAGVDIVTDGEARRESYSNRLATALDGIDPDRPGEVRARSGAAMMPVPRVVGKIVRKSATEARDVRFLRANTDRTIKITLPGPFTMVQQAQNDYYRDEEEMAMDYAVAVNAEIRDLKAAGADVIQLDEPWLQARTDAAARYGITAINRALEGVPGPTALHLCFGYAYVARNKPSGYSFLTQLAACDVQQISIEAAQPNVDLAALRELPGKTIILGVIDLGDERIETPETVAARIRAGLAHVPADRIIPAPDCGMKYLPRDIAFGKLRAMVQGTAIVRRELAGPSSE
jgi:5-methyltetrahydropteroyltriglutamate--homocysteine methyltransferase